MYISVYIMCSAVGKKASSHVYRDALFLVYRSLHTCVLICGTNASTTVVLGVRCSYILICNIVSVLLLLIMNVNLCRKKNETKWSYSYSCLHILLKRVPSPR